ncbi:hypothetical protein ACFC4G_46695 [Streptomyces sp. NPDC056002]|uniref:hypothetical protein n=1 Tax=Streptomyces sp. NPDC056002 TaxID=3345675 RepID=UPI0035DB984A
MRTFYDFHLREGTGPIHEIRPDSSAGPVYFVLHDVDGEVRPVNWPPPCTPPFTATSIHSPAPCPHHLTTHPRRETGLFP